MTIPRYLTVATLLLFFALLISCSGKKPTPPDLDSPGTPALLGPSNNDTEVELDEALVWRCADPNGDSLSYALYFGETNPPPLLIDKLTDTSYVVKDIAPGITYFWKVVATDPDGNTSASRIMTFATTRSFQYPLTPGNRWGYDWAVVYDSASGTFVDSATIGEATVEVEADTVLFDSLPATILQDRTYDGRSVHESRFYSGNTDRGMFTYAYSSGSSVMPGKATEAYRVTVNGASFDSPTILLQAIRLAGQGSARAANVLYVEDPPVLVYAYPLEEGSHWTYRPTSNPWQVDRRIVDYSEIEVPAGKFKAFKIAWLVDLDNDGTPDANIVYNDWVAAEGLIRRDLLVSDVVVTGQVGDSLGVMNIHESYVLRDYGSE